MRKKIIIAPLNWGLGHASRCIPIIKSLVKKEFIPIIASDGAALKLLHKEFPELETIELPSYDITYGKNVKASLLKQTPTILSAVKKEEKIVENYIFKNKSVAGIISDNRFGVRNKKVPSVYITHQLNVLSGISSYLTTRMHKSIINKFDECWVPDTKDNQLSGKLSLTKGLNIPVKQIGIFSRFSPEELPKKNDILILLSGPEPNRTQLEEKLLNEFKGDTRAIMLVQGKVEEEQRNFKIDSIYVINYLLSHQLQRSINQSELIICRSGYSSILDLAVLGKKAFFIPTKGQSEQEYLAEYLDKQKITPYSSEDSFTVSKLENIKNYSGFKKINNKFNSNVLDLF